MAKIYSPNESYTGISATVQFKDGVGETDNPRLIEWFKEHGYTTEANTEVTDAEADADEVPKTEDTSNSAEVDDIAEETEAEPDIDHFADAGNMVDEIAETEADNTEENADEVPKTRHNRRNKNK